MKHLPEDIPETEREHGPDSPGTIDDAVLGDGQPTSMVPGTHRWIGLDVGDRRIGVAVSDPLGYTAQPLFTLHRSGRRSDLKSIARVARKHGTNDVVVGNPLHMSGDLSPQAIKAQAFAQELRSEFGLSVHLWDERLSTAQAHRQLDESGRPALGRKNIIDQVAAVLILQSFLDAEAARVADRGLPAPAR